MSPDEAVKILETSGIFFDVDEEDAPEERTEKHLINLNDVFGWGCADGEKVEDSEMVALADLLHGYGWCGVLYWVSQKRGGQKSEFHDNNRLIEFVANEERIKKEVPDTNKRAYHKTKYTLGVV